MSVTPQVIWQTYRIAIILGAVSLLFIVLSITIFIKSYQSALPVTFSSDANAASVRGEATASADVNRITVDIEGGVKSPGVYTMHSGARVEDAIEISGGFSAWVDSDAVAKSLNRATRLSDGAKLYIPTKTDSAKAGQTGIAVSSSTAGSTQSGPVSVNTASSSQLDTLPGVGTVTVEKIIAGRPYMRLEELVEKKTMSQAVFTKIKDQISL